MSQKKARAARLLREYDKMRAEFRALERELTSACTDYGREIGYWGYRIETLRIALENEERAKQKEHAA